MKKIEGAEKVIFICEGKKCGRYSKELRKAFKSAIKEAGLKKKIFVARMGCSDNCKCAPVLCIQPENEWLGEVKSKDIPDIISKQTENNNKQ